MTTAYATGKKAKALCDVCGFTYRLRDLKLVTRNRHSTGLLACSECWEPDHPQHELGRYPVYDPQALRNPRPDHSELAKSRELITPLTSVHGKCLVGTVTVAT